MRNLLQIYLGKVLLMAMLLAGISSWGQIASDGLNNSTSLFSISGSAGVYYSTSSASSESPASSPFFIEGTHAYGKSNGIVVLTSGDINTTGYTGIQVSFRLASFSINSNGNGAEAGDTVNVEISPNGGTNWYSTVRVLGNSNANWGYSATGVASTAYDGNATAVDFSPSGGGLRTTDGYSTVRVTSIPAATNIKLRITMTNNAANELWLIDNVQITGTAAVPSVVTNAPTVINATSATLSGTANANGASALTLSFQYGLTTGYGSNATGVSPTTASGTSSTGFTGTASGLTPNTTYNYKASGTNGTVYNGSNVSFVTLANAPGTPTVANPTTTTLTVDINTVNSNPATTQYAIQETTTGRYILANGTLGTTSTAVWQTAAVWNAATITGLTPGTTYTFRAKGRNNTSGSPTDTTFSSTASAVTLANTPGVPVVNGATITTLDVTLNATTQNSNAAATVYAIQEAGGQYVQANGSLGATAVWQTAATWGAKTITGLAPNTTYTFSVKARNSAGVETAFGSTASGTTLPATPTLSASGLNAFGSVCIDITAGPNDFLLGGEYLDSSTVTVGPLAGFTFATASDGVFASTVEFTADANGDILADVFVKFSPVAAQSYSGNIPVSGGGATSINIAVSATGVNTKATITTPTSASVSATTAVLGGNITAEGCSDVTERGIYYSTVNGFADGAGEKVSEAGSFATGSFTLDVTGLSQGTTYYYKSFAANNGGEAYSAQGNFTTSITAPVATEATYLAGSQVGFVANWEALEGVTDYRLDLSTSPTFGTVTPTTDLFFSQYVEGSSTNRYLEIYNGTGEDVDLADYRVRLYSNGASTIAIGGSNDVQLSGTLANGAVLVIKNSGATLYAGTATVVASANFTGDDAVALFKISTASNVDIIGRIGDDPGTAWTSDTNSTIDKTLVRRSTVTGGVTTNPTGTGATAFTTLESEWIQYDQNTLTDLGMHTYAGNEPSFVDGYEDLGVSGISHNVTGLTAGTTYYYRVRAQGANEVSGNSNTIEAIAKRENTWTSGAWTQGAPPTAFDKAIIESNYNTAANGGITAGELEVNNGTFTIADGTNVTITNKVAVDNDLVGGVITGNGRIVIENNANLVQVADVDNSGYITVNKKSAPMFRLDYALWSSPVAGETLIGFSPMTNTTRFYHYNPLSDAYATVAGTTGFAEGESYLIRVANDHPAFDEGDTEGVQWEGFYTGVPNNGDVDVAVTPAEGSIQGYNAIGNPYPSPINIHAFYDANIGSIDQASALYFWRKKNEAGTGSYAKVTKLAYTANLGNDFGNAAGTAFNGAPETWVINPGQGFIVQATGAAVHFNNQMRVAVNNNQQFRTAQDEETVMSRLWLNLTDANGGFSQTAIGYTDETTLDLDYGWDGKAFVNDGDMSLFSLADETTLGIQARPSFDDADEVPMGYKTDLAGTFTIALDHMDGVFALDQDIFLRDNVLGITHDLKEGAYEFATEAGINTERFDVIYAQPLGTDKPVTDVNNVIVYKQGNSININSGTIIHMTAVSVYDMRGRLLYSGKDINATETLISGLQAEKQVLIVNISTSKGEVSKKIVF
jgi:Lamin Tail Domain